MHKIACRILLVSLVGSYFHGAPAPADDELDAAFDKDVLIIVASANACYRFDIYLATDPPKRQRGLMFVKYLPPMTGMLFVYQSPQYLSMWMKNTYIPLDMVFVRGDGSVASIVENTEPLSLHTISATEPVNFVLELNAGTAGRLHIDGNSRLIWVPKETE